mmetsp:Transcript_2036/g.3212  ORF Transcript_2036/g.3212 Transcript_2036/m.3212 type:complete len:364 (+) Transcript_2036:250-1341(+)|eukprot:CAMPEP_0119024750 /NCGR_PEP_ID=MMETSP1176-20130426/32478_1 /TAXON_ID=265551 /ORGANISM="Synedropsis recta cf, Strain CCMP1620" /LENGTH=363 /DNA_ID=CAMNT_0006980141 /DNA_START=172 /DNA_END=1263 /DNA_ORIENTATION=+
MKKFFAPKMQKEDYAALALSNSATEKNNSSFLEGDDQVETPPVVDHSTNNSTLDRIEDEDDEHHDDDDDDVRPSNEYVLNIAFFSFLGFMSVQAVFALMANSESMLADSEAMSVDALTYLFNMCAERIKKQPYSEYERTLAKPIRERRRTMKRLYLELVPPLISVSTLLAVTFVTIQDSYDAMFGVKLSDEPEEKVDVTIMLIFSALNLLLDIVNVFCFARADQAFGLQSIPGFESKPGDLVKMSSRGGVEVELHGENKHASEETRLVPTTAESPPEDTFYGVNLNMCSAWTHICADTMRSVAVLIAALIASIFSSVDGETADATAAVVVSIIIIVSLLPLLHGLFLTAKEIVVLSKTPIVGA